MTWEGVPWMIAGGEHSAEVGRVLAYAASGGGEGVIGPTDCKVVASAIPDGNVHIQPGAIGALNRFAGGGQQSYLMRNVGDEAIALTAQGSAGVRYDLVAVIVEDPQYAGQPVPPSVPDGPYLRTVVYEGVTSTTRKLEEVDPNQTGYALARVKFDASDGTVNPVDITDLRELLAPRIKQVKKMFNAETAANNIGSAYELVPPGATWDVEIPTWASHVQLEAQWSGITCLDTGADGGTAGGHAIVSLGAIETPAAVWYENAVGPGRQTRMTHMAAEESSISEALRGTTQPLQAKMRKTTGSGMNVRSDYGSTVVATATFYELLA